MDIFFHVSTEAGGRRLLRPLALACARAGHTFAAFFTHEGVRALADPALVDALRAAHTAAVCEESWHRYATAGQGCPVALGSQTTNSALIGAARRVVSL